MWLDEARIWTHSPIARSNEERMRVYTTSTCILLLIKIKEQQPFRSLSIFQHVTPTHMHKSRILIVKLLFLAVVSNVYNLLHLNSLIYNKVHPQTLWKPSLDSLIHIQKSTTGTATTVLIHVSTTTTTTEQRKGPHQRKRLSKEGCTSRRTLKKQTIYRKKQT